ncbi:MAG: TrmB family transcriptional regulator [archaeon]
MERWKYLSELGFREYQSKALACLLQEDNLTAEKISSETSIPYSRIYSVLNNLEDMNLVISNSERPKKYKIEDENKILSYVVEKKRRELKRIKQRVMETREKFTSIGFSEMKMLDDY